MPGRVLSLRSCLELSMKSTEGKKSPKTQGRGGKERHKSTTANLQIMVYAKRPDGLPELDHSVKLNPHMDQCVSSGAVV